MASGATRWGPRPAARCTAGRPLLPPGREWLSRGCSGWGRLRCPRRTQVWETGLGAPPGPWETLLEPPSGPASCSELYL